MVPTLHRHRAPPRASPSLFLSPSQVIVIGFSVDYTVHLGHVYCESKASTRQERVTAGQERAEGRAEESTCVKAKTWGR